jgi:hypothetical protein
MKLELPQILRAVLDVLLAHARNDRCGSVVGEGQSKTEAQINLRFSAPLIVSFPAYYSANLRKWLQQVIQPGRPRFPMKSKIPTLGHAFGFAKKLTARRKTIVPDEKTLVAEKCALNQSSVLRSQWQISPH